MSPTVSGFSYGKEWNEWNDFLDCEVCVTRERRWRIVISFEHWIQWAATEDSQLMIGRIACSRVILKKVYSFLARSF